MTAAPNRLEQAGKETQDMAADRLSASRLLEEAEKMRRVPGITFADGPCGRVARIAGTGLEVFEVIQSYRQMGEDLESLLEAFHWLKAEQILSALKYAREYPEEIDAILAEADALVPEEIKRQAAFRAEST